MEEINEKLWMYPNGMGADGHPLFEPQSTEDLAKLASGQTRATKDTHAASLRELQWRHKSKGEAHFGVKEGIHPEKLEETGLGVILPATKEGTPEAAAQREILDALKPLLDWRREQATRNHEKYFQIFQGPRGYIQGESKQKYLARLGTGPSPADPEKGVPYYLLIVASPQVIPYHMLWEDAKRATALLLGDEALPDAEHWANDHPKRLTGGEREFLAQSRELRAKKQAARGRLVALATVAVIVAVVVAVLGVAAWVARDQARQAEETALAAKATAVVARNRSEAARDQARLATLMASVGERLARGQDGPAALLLAEMKNPEEARGWDQLAIDVLGKNIPMFTVHHEGRVMAASWSPDGTRFVTASADKTAFVWNAEGSGEPRVLKGHQDCVVAASWSPDGTRIVTASGDTTARVWNADGSGKPLVLNGHRGTVDAASWSPDGTRIVTASDDKTARVWNADGSGEPLVLHGHEGRLRSTSWSPDGTRIATASNDKTARVWQVSIPALHQALRDATLECLSPAQRETYLLESRHDAVAAYQACEHAHGRAPRP